MISFSPCFVVLAIAATAYSQYITPGLGGYGAIDPALGGYATGYGFNPALAYNPALRGYGTVNPALMGGYGSYPQQQGGSSSQASFSSNSGQVGKK
uniref:Uncharacterized protein n=1 Tax=Panagrolaimus superbus TaxID=310955 RepID=A0A914YW90_9BILA